ncbi:hypothetical protein [Streptomyces sp. NPDC004682]
MSPDPAPSTGRRAISPLDRRIEAATGHDVETLWAFRNRGVLGEALAHLVDQHSAMAKSEAGVTYHRQLLNRLSSGELPVDDALLGRITRTVEQLADAADTHSAATRKVIAALEPIESAATVSAARQRPLSTDDQATLLAIAGGAKLYEHLLTSRMSVTTASGARIPHARLLKLEEAGLVSRDTGHPVHAGQPVTLTEAGRAALLAPRRPPATDHVPTRPARPGAWPSTRSRQH